MVNNELGDVTSRHADTTTVEATEEIDAGDFIAMDQSEDDDRYPPAAQLQDDTTPDVDQMAGVALEDMDDGDRGTVLRGGSVIANVATGVDAGERLDASTAAGQADTEDGGPAVAWSDEGGTDSAGTDLGDNEAEVSL